MMVVLVMGTLMYVIEGAANGYTSIPVGIYRAITTMTTVGFGDITPKTDLGRAVASVMMLLGWGILAVPTGIVSASSPPSASAARRCHCASTAAGKGIEAAARFAASAGRRWAERQRFGSSASSGMGPAPACGPRALRWPSSMSAITAMACLAAPVGAFATQRVAQRA